MNDQLINQLAKKDILMYVIIGIFSVFTLWILIAEIDQVVRAEGAVEPVGKVQQIQSRFPGTISKLNISVGDYVTTQDELMSLDTRDIKHSVDSLEDKLALLTEQVEIIKPLVKEGVESKMTLIQTQKELLDVKDSLNKAKIQLQQSSLFSPINGVITAVNVRGQGAVIDGGSILAEVVPKEEYYLVKVRILPKDISKVSIGQKARVSFLAYDYSQFGVMEGVLKNIAQNSTVVEDGTIFYDAWIQTNGDTFSNSGINPNILPGMLATVDMLGEKRTIFEYIMSPLSVATNKALSEM